MQRLVSSVAAVALVGLTGCITDPVTGESKFGMPTSEQEEIGMGKSYRPVILQQFSGAYPDDDLQRHLAPIVLGMAHRSVRPDLPWTFTVLNSSVPNAFAVPGGEVFMTRGLLWRLDDEAEFAVVMGHEIGHVEHRHTVQSMARDQIVGSLGVIAGRAAGAEEIGSFLASLGIARFSRDQERESDVRGVNHSYHAGYDPRQGADVFRKFLEIKQEQGGGESVIDAWTSSHPLDTERIESVGRLAAEIDPRLAGAAAVPGLRVQTREFQQLIAKLRAEEDVYDRHDAALAAIVKSGVTKESVRAAIPTFEACARDLPNHAFFASTAGKAHMVAGDSAGARKWLDRAASMNQGLLEPEYLLGRISLEANDFQESMSHAERGLALMPGNYQCTWIRGESLVGLGRSADARADFEQVVQTAPPDSEEYQASAKRLGGTSQPAPAKKKAKR